MRFLRIEFWKKFSAIYPYLSYYLNFFTNMGTTDINQTNFLDSNSSTASGYKTRS